MKELTLSLFKTEAAIFVRELTARPIFDLYGITDGKAIGTYVEQAFNKYLISKYLYTPGSAASGIDFPELEVDLKVTSIRQPQSSCPFRDASQKVYGLGYHLLVFVYEKIDNQELRAASLNFKSAIFVAKEKTGDYQTTRGLIEIISRNGNQDDVIGFLEDRNLPLDEIGREILAERIIKEPPQQGYITISNALQWRLQYRRIIEQAEIGNIAGVENILV
ncbi:MAG: restriction endonuclease [Okeania sp. SIO2G4]|uniref:restriction endonuclease n=1 Tax=unclassified Okeania TaxID=2634635 RepID=UPI0013B6516B|nr:MULTISPECIES: restriction endonuclease [unclassified Okeania]NEP38608.1 restriction endonuclease [Okeania sp. SIO2H7]NEP73916.1 restriction endonuclease [Okeania sp. SIO2G5]NEP94729.1 restriction endonuclease [Okeania sp. SIO2F5]NEQ92454.1 restriction endonuclease [Okeania sp. SIO2G4]